MTYSLLRPLVAAYLVFRIALHNALTASYLRFGSSFGSSLEHRMSGPRLPNQRAHRSSRRARCRGSGSATECTRGSPTAPRRTSREVRPGQRGRPGRTQKRTRPRALAWPRAAEERPTRRASRHEGALPQRGPRSEIETTPAELAGMPIHIACFRQPIIPELAVEGGPLLT